MLTKPYFLVLLLVMPYPSPHSLSSRLPLCVHQPSRQVCGVPEYSLASVPAVRNCPGRTGRTQCVLVQEAVEPGSARDWCGE